VESHPDSCTADRRGEDSGSEGARDKYRAWKMLVEKIREYIELEKRQREILNNASLEEAIEIFFELSRCGLGPRI
jgi:hypothetical protein